MDLCDRREIQELLERHGFRFSKAMGQNFLIADWVPRQIAEACGADEQTGVLEIGPGVGCLTRELCRRAGKVASVEIMYGIQTLINIIIPSGSAKAAITMPIMAPFSDLIGVCRQATVMAFQFGDGFTNMITPTSGVLIGALGVAKIPYNKWFKWVWKFILMMIIIGGILLIPTVLIPLEGF